MKKRLTLTDAIKTGKLQEFVDEQEKRGVGPLEISKFDEAIQKIVKPQPPERQTSRSQGGDGSRGKRTR